MFPLQPGLTVCRACVASQHTVAVAVPDPLEIPCFYVWGSNSSQDNFFGFFSFSQLSATVNQWRIFFEWLYRLTNTSCHWSHITKSCCDWDSNPLPGNVEFGVAVPLPRYADLQHTQSKHAAEENRESALWLSIASYSVLMGVFIRQLALSASR